MAAELVARAGEVDRLRTDLEAVQAESQTLRSEVAQLSQRAEETQRKLDSEVAFCLMLRCDLLLMPQEAKVSGNKVSGALASFVLSKRYWYATNVLLACC